MFFLRCRLTITMLIMMVAVSGWAGPDDSESPTKRLPEIVVEGVREVADVQQIAGTVSTPTVTELDTAGIFSVRDLASFTPNLYVSYGGAQSFGDIYTIRGLANTQFFSDPAVVMYVDGAPYGDTFTYATDLFEIDRVEVWSGPQGTTFGKNSEAGVINIVTRKPGPSWSVDAAAGGGSFDAFYGRGRVAGPIVREELSMEVAGVYARRNGFIDNDNLDTDPDSLDGFDARGLLRWTPAEDWEISFSATGGMSDDGVRIVPLSGDSLTTLSDFDGQVDTSSNGEVLRIAHATQRFLFTSVTARWAWSLDPFTLDLDFSPFAGNSARIEQQQVQWSEELRLQSPTGTDDLQWLAGIFFSTSATDGDSQRDFFVPVPGFFASERTQFDSDGNDYAVFGQVSFPLHDRLDLTLGLRLDYTTKSLQRTKTSTFGPVPSVDTQQDFFNAAPKLTIAYHVSDTALLYGSTGTGFKPGGFSAFIDPPASPSYDTEVTWANEIGFKSSWWEKRLIVRVALFYYDTWDYQVERSITGTTDLTIFNAPEVVSKGAELELVAEPIAGLQLSAVLGYTDARFVDFQDPATGADLDGNHPPYVPNFTASLAAQYTHRSGVFGRVEMLGVGDTFFDEANTSSFEQPAYALLNARLGYQAKHFSVYLYGQNLTDTEYFTKKIPELSAGVPGVPLSFGALVTVAF